MKPTKNHSQETKPFTPLKMTKPDMEVSDGVSHNRVWDKTPDASNGSQTPAEIKDKILKEVIGEDGWCAFCKNGLETGENYCEECKQRLIKAISLTLAECEKEKQDLFDYGFRIGMQEQEIKSNKNISNFVRALKDKVKNNIIFSHNLKDDEFKRKEILMEIDNLAKKYGVGE